MLSLEKLKINERLHNVELQVARLVSHMESEQGTFARIQAGVDENFRRLTLIIDRHDKIIFGDGTPGMVTKQDRLEQAENTRRWHFGVIWAGIVGLLLKMIHDIFK